MIEKMDLTPITTQPLKSSENSEKLPESPPEVLNNGHIESKKEDLTETTAVFDPAGQLDENLTEEEKEKRRQRHEEATDCCCYSPYYSDDTDAFCLYILCNWICDCFRGIGHCTEECFEGCANCITECCEGEGGCLDCCTCDGAEAGNAAVDTDCFGGCLECCANCDCGNCDCST